MEEISVIGIDLAKLVFQLSAVTRSGAIVWEKQLRRAAMIKFLEDEAPLPDWDGGVRQRASLGALAAGAWLPGQADGAASGQGLSRRGADRQSIARPAQ